MKFVTFKTPKNECRAGWAVDGGVIDMNHISKGRLPSDMLTFLEDNEKYMQIIKNELFDAPATYPFHEIELLAPLLTPVNFRDYMGFKEHPEHIVANGKRPVPSIYFETYFEIAAFYFSNRFAMLGPSQPVSFPDRCKWPDYEFEIGCIIGKQGHDIKPEEADDYIFGYTVLCDWSARDLQFQEMPCRLGPVKGKDFATSIGPWIVTRDELEKYRLPDGRFDMKLIASRNGEIFVRDNLQAIYHPFAHMIARASENNVDLYPGDLIGSGTVGNGCIMELPGEPATKNWLTSGDVLEFEVEGIGKLTLTVA